MLHGEIGTVISETSKRVLVLILLLPGRQASDSVPIFDRGTGSKPARLGQAQIRFPAQFDSIE